jgi:hypothetical protein
MHFIRTIPAGQGSRREPLARPLLPEAVLEELTSQAHFTTGLAEPLIERFAADAEPGGGPAFFAVSCGKCAAGL